MNDKIKDYRALPDFEMKQIPTFVKEVDDDLGIVTHFVAIFGNVDEQNDRIMPNSFKKSLSERMLRVKVLDQHGTDTVLRVVGKPIQLREVGRTELTPDVLTYAPDATGGLLATTQYAIETARAHDIFKLVKGGFLPEASIGYDAIQAEFKEEEGPDGKQRRVRELKEIRLWEYSNVIFGANRATNVVGAKAGDPENKDASTQDESADPNDKGAGGATNLPLAARVRTWDAGAAVNRVRSWADATDEPNAKYRRAFFWHDPDALDQFGSYKFPFSDIVSGELTAIPRAIFNGAARLDGSDIPDADKAAIRTRMGRYYAKMRREFDDDSLVPPWEKADGGELDQKLAKLLVAVRELFGETKLTASITDALIRLPFDEGDDKEMTDHGPVQRLGDVLAAAIHRTFTVLADGWAIEGRLSQDQRIAMSGAIGAALDVLNARIPQEIHQMEVFAWVDSVRSSEGGDEAKIGRAISAANMGRIRGAIDGVQAALTELETMLEAALPKPTEDEGRDDDKEKTAPVLDVQAAGNGEGEDGAGPVDGPPTADLLKSIQLEMIEIEMLEMEAYT